MQAAAFDQVLGIHFMKAVGAGFTASLTVDYRKPIPVQTTVVFRSTVVKREGRKVYLEARAEDAQGLLLAEARALFVTADVRSAAKMAARQVTRAFPGAAAVRGSAAVPAEASE